MAGEPKFICGFCDAPMHPEALFDDGDEIVCDGCGWSFVVHPATPQQEPEGDGIVTPWMISAGMSMYAPGFDLVDCDAFAAWLSDRLRARVQPRRVSEAVFEAVVKEIKTGYLTYANPDEVAVDVLDILGIEITPTEGD